MQLQTSNPEEGIILSNLASPGCPNIVQYLMSYSFPVYNGSIRGYCIVMDACQGTFTNLIKATRWLNLGEISILTRQVMEALAYLEEKAILHK